MDFRYIKRKLIKVLNASSKQIGYKEGYADGVKDYAKAIKRNLSKRIVIPMPFKPNQKIYWILFGYDDTLEIQKGTLQDIKIMVSDNATEITYIIYDETTPDNPCITKLDAETKSFYRTEKDAQIAKDLFLKTNTQQ